MAKDIRGIGFKIADQIAIKMGIPARSMTRIRAGDRVLLWELSNDGHTCYPREELETHAAAMLIVDELEVREGLKRSLDEGDVIEDAGFISLKPFFLAERGISFQLKRLTESPSSLRSVHLEKAVPWAEKKLKIAFAEEQKKAMAQSSGKSPYHHRRPRNGQKHDYKEPSCDQRKTHDKISSGSPHWARRETDE